MINKNYCITVINFKQDLCVFDNVNVLLLFYILMNSIYYLFIT